MAARSKSLEGAVDDVPRSLDELQVEVERLLALWFALDLQPVSVTWRPAMRTRAGVAWLEERAIELNPRLLAQNPDKLHEILAHELAHLVVWSRHGRKAREHGPEWCALMELAGYRPSRFHGMDVRDLRQRRRRYYYLHVCETCASWWIARRVRRDRDCRSCGPGEVRVMRAPGTSAGLAELQKRARAQERRGGDERPCDTLADGRGGVRDV